MGRVGHHHRGLFHRRHHAPPCSASAATWRRLLLDLRIAVLRPCVRPSGPAATCAVSCCACQRTHAQIGARDQRLHAHQRKDQRPRLARAGCGSDGAEAGRCRHQSPRSGSSACSTAPQGRGHHAQLDHATFPSAPAFPDENIRLIPRAGLTRERSGISAAKLSRKPVCRNGHRDGGRRRRRSRMAQGGTACISGTVTAACRSGWVCTRSDLGEPQPAGVLPVRGIELDGQHGEAAGQARRAG